MRNKHYSWSAFGKDIETIASTLQGYKFDEIYGIPRGGLIIAVVLSHRLELPLSLEFHLKEAVGVSFFFQKLSKFAIILIHDYISLRTGYLQEQAEIRRNH